MDPTVQLIAMIVGPLVGAGAGSYFGLRGAINGLRERSARIESTLGEVRDHARDTAVGFRDYARDGRVAMVQIARLYEERDHA
jgi:hypothetical protein